MFKQHTTIFITFHPGDAPAARKAIAELARRFPNRTFGGRHTVSSDEAAARAIQTATLTVILETGKTYRSPDVLHDIRVSWAKVPPNQILRICLESEDEAVSDSGVVTELTEWGVERVACDPATILDAIERLDMLPGHEQKLKKAASSPARSSSNCGR